jgi:hypothetical protein
MWWEIHLERHALFLVPFTILLMKNTQSKLPPLYKVINMICRLLELSSLPVMRLDETSLCDTAIKQTGLSDFGDPHYREGLSQLLKSIHNKNANFHALGRFMTRKIILNYLTQRLLFVQCKSKEAEIFQTPLIGPIIITGLARSGTTFLHNMLSIDPSHRAIPLWLLTRPFPEQPGKTGRKDFRRIKMEQSIRFRQPLLKGLDSVHYFRADSAEECINLLGITFNSLIFPTLLPVSKYAEWYMKTSDACQKYQEYREFLQYYQSQAPDKRLVMKAPAHTGNLEALLQSVPEVMIIQTHRDPVTCIKSVSNLLYTFHRSAVRKLNIPETSRLTLRMYKQWLLRNLDFRSKHPDVIYDVHYNTLVSDPIGTVRNIYQHFGLPWTDMYASRLRNFVAENPKNKHGTHHYSADEFGLHEEEITKQFQFYTEQFGL